MGQFLAMDFSKFHCSWETCALFGKLINRKFTSIWGLVLSLVSFSPPFVSVVDSEPGKLCKKSL